MWNIIDGYIFQDAREVRTKNSKTIMTYFPARRFSLHRLFHGLGPVSAKGKAVWP